MGKPGEQRDDLTTPTRPEECALLVAVPLTRNAFLSDLEDTTRHDFARFVTGIGEPATAWCEQGYFFAELVKRVMDTAESYGVRVVREARLSDVTDTFSDFPAVVTIVAHWRGADLAGRDIRGEPKEIVERIANALSGQTARNAVSELLGGFQANLSAVLAHEDRDERRSFFAKLLNEQILESNRLLPFFLPPVGVETTVVSDLWLRTWNRDFLDACAGGLILPGNRLELRDGLHDTRAIAACVPEAWSGQVDLTVCHSALLGQVIKDGRSDRRFALRKKPVDILLSLTVLLLLYRDIGTGSHNYLARLAALFRELMKELRALNVHSRIDLFSYIQKFLRLGG
jgi:hypothetical protein